MINNELFLEGRKVPNLNPLSQEYRDWWYEQFKRCTEGYTVGGKFMPPQLYFYVNFGTIELLDEKTGRKRQGRPDLRDVEWLVFNLFHQARQEKKGIIWISGRRGGKSYCSSGIAAHEMTFYPDNELIISAFFSKYSNDLMNKLIRHLDGLYNTPFYHNRLKSDPEKEIRTGYELSVGGVKRRAGYNSRAFNIVFKDKHQAAVGKSTSYFAFEEIGQFDNLLEAYGASEPCWKEGSKWFGTPFLAGTGGDMEKGSLAAQKMFYDPETYNFVSVDTWEGKDTSKEYYRTAKTGFFLPGYMVLNDFKDGQGITDIPAAKVELTRQRDVKRRGRDNKAYIQDLQYYPFTPEEAFIISGGNIFPRDLIQMQIDNILTSKHLSNIGLKGRLEWTQSETNSSTHHSTVTFIAENKLNEAPFPFNAKENNTGCIVIYEMPEYVNEQIPFGLYIAGTDPYAMDEAIQSESLGSTFVYKRFYSPNKTHDIIVAEYTGRPDTLEDYAENLRKLLVFYNAKCLYENNVRGIKEYFEKVKCVHLLIPQPEIISNILTDSKVKRSHGIHMNIPIKQYALSLIKDYLISSLGGSSSSGSLEGKDLIEAGTERKYNVENIYSIYLLRELINYNEDDNFDRVIAFGLVLLANIEYTNVQVKKQLGVESAGKKLSEIADRFKAHMRFTEDDYKYALYGE